MYNWLCDERKGKWVIILDNADDASFLIKNRSVSQDGRVDGIIDDSVRPLISYLPQCPNGSILITARSQDVALKLVEQRDIIMVEPMNLADALALLEKKLGGYKSTEEATQLAVALEFMPLAIVQAAAYISQRAPRCSVHQYLQDFQKSDRKRTSLLDYEGGQLRRDWEARNSIMITWQLSFDYIRETQPSAADLLSLMSFFDRQGIPEALLRIRDEQQNSQQDQESKDERHTDINTSYSDDEDDNQSQSSKNEGFENDVQVLRNYMFISIDTNNTAFEMHRLVQLATRKWLEAHKQQERWKQQFLKNLCIQVPIGEYENWVEWRMLFPHAQSAIAQRPEEQDSLKDWALVMHRAAWYALQVGKWVEAEEMAVQAMKTRRKILGPESEDTLWSMGLVGYTYSSQGRWDAAEELEVQVMETSQKKFGAKHPGTLTSMANLASTYRDQGRWNAAEELEIQVMETRKKELGAAHPDTLTSMANLASTYSDQGRWDAAEELEVQALETRKKKLGAEHPDTLTSMANLASTYSDQGRWDAAEELEVQALETRKKKLGAEHPDTLTSMANLASTYSDQGRWDAAEELEIQVMETRKKELGAAHPDTLTSMANLASTYSDQGRWDAAEELEVQVLETRKKKFGADHLHTLASVGNLAMIYGDQGRLNAAEELEVQVMETYKKKLGADHPDTLNSMNNLAETWKEIGRQTEAIRLMEECIQSRQRVLGVNHPDTISSCRTLEVWKAEA